MSRVFSRRQTNLAVFLCDAGFPLVGLRQTDNRRFAVIGVAPHETTREPALVKASRLCLDSGMEASAQRSSTERVFWLLFLFLNSFYLLTSSGRVRTIDEVTADYQAESLVRRGDLSVPQAVAAGNYYGKLDRWGRPQAPYGAAQAGLLVPWYLAGLGVSTWAPGVPPQARDLVLDAVLTASSATFAAMAGALVFLILVRRGLRHGPGLATAGVVAFSTPLLAYSSWLFSEPLAAVLLLGAAAILFIDDGDASVPRAAAAGVVLGAALWVRPAHALAVPVFVLALVVRGRRRAILPAAVLAVVAAAFGAAFLVRNQMLFGSFLDFGYPAAAEGGRRLNTFETPVLTGLFGFLFSPGKSVFLFAPPVIVAMAGLRRLARLDRGLAVIAAGVPLVYLLFYARYTQWEGGYCLGPRYLVPAIPLLCLACGPVMQSGGRSMVRLAVLLAVAGFLVQTVGMSTSFLEDQAGGAYYDLHWNYRMSYSPLVSQTERLVEDLLSSQPAPIGRGFDRWFVFLFKGGVALASIAVVLFLESCATLFFAWLVWRSVTRPTTGGDRLRLAGGSPEPLLRSTHDS